MTNLYTVSSRLGMTEEEAERAMGIGARMMVHGFTGKDLDRMILWIYEQWATEPGERTFGESWYKND